MQSSFVHGNNTYLLFNHCLTWYVLMHHVCVWGRLTLTVLVSALTRSQITSPVDSRQTMYQGQGGNCACDQELVRLFDNVANTLHLLFDKISRKRSRRESVVGKVQYFILVLCEPHALYGAFATLVQYMSGPSMLVF